MFNDAELNKIVEDHSKQIDSHIEFLNKLSSDIKKLNDLIRNAAIPRGISLPIPSLNGSLIWDGSSVVWTSSLVTRSLIETPKEIRMRCKPYLHDFLKLCLDSIGEK